MHKCIQTQLIARKDQPLYVYGRQTVCHKRKRIGKPNTGSENMLSVHRDGICHRQKSAMLVMKRRKRYQKEGIELPNQEKKSELWKLGNTRGGHH